MSPDCAFSGKPSAVHLLTRNRVESDKFMSCFILLAWYGYAVGECLCILPFCVADILITLFRSIDCVLNYSQIESKNKEFNHGEYRVQLWCESSAPRAHSFRLAWKKIYIFMTACHFISDMYHFTLKRALLILNETLFKTLDTFCSRSLF